MLDAGQHGWVANLVAIEVQDRQHGSVGNWVQKLVGLPCGGQRPRFRFAVADNARDDQTGIVECRPESMADRIPQFAAFVNRRSSRIKGIESRCGFENQRATRIDNGFAPGASTKTTEMNSPPK